MKALEIEDLIAVFNSGDDQKADDLARQVIATREDAWELMAPLLIHEDADVRWWSVRTLAGVAHPEVSKHLIHMLRDVDISVRQCAALALREAPSPLAVDTLIECLDEADPLLRRLCGDALIAVGSEAVPLLIEALEDGSQNVKRESARALAEIGDTRAIGPLFQAWEDGSSVVQYWAEIGIDRMGVGMRFFKNS